MIHRSAAAAAAAQLATKDMIRLAGPRPAAELLTEAALTASTDTAPDVSELWQGVLARIVAHLAIVQVRNLMHWLNACMPYGSSIPAPLCVHL